MSWNWQLVRLGALQFTSSGSTIFGAEGPLTVHDLAILVACLGSFRALFTQRAKEPRIPKYQNGELGETGSNGNISEKRPFTRLAATFTRNTRHSDRSDLSSLSGRVIRPSAWLDIESGSHSSGGSSRNHLLFQKPADKNSEHNLTNTRTPISQPLPMSVRATSGIAMSCQHCGKTALSTVAIRHDTDFTSNEAPSERPVASNWPIAQYRASPPRIPDKELNRERSFPSPRDA